MLRFEWNALRVGDNVLVHANDAAMRLAPGVVAMVDTSRRSSDIGVRMTPARGSADAQASQVLRPARLAVHFDPRDTSEPCWRCDAIAEATT